MANVRDPRWNTMCGSAPGPGDPRVWEDELEAADSLATPGGILKHSPLHRMEVAGRRTIYFKRCRKDCFQLAKDPKLHGRHVLVGESYGLGTGPAGYESKLYHPVAADYIRTLPTANISQALINIRYVPLSKNIWLHNGDMNGWYKSGILQDKDFIDFDKLRQRTVQAMEAELAARGEDIRRNPEPAANLGIWMSPKRPDPFTAHGASLAGEFPLPTQAPFRLTQTSPHVLPTIRQKPLPINQRRHTLSVPNELHSHGSQSQSIGPIAQRSLSAPPESRSKKPKQSMIARIKSLVRKGHDKPKNIPWRWRLHGIKEPWNSR